MIKVLVVDDSLTSRRYLQEIINADEQLQVIGSAASGQEALTLVRRLRPDVLTMDIQMPGLDGFEATRAIMEASPLPIVVISGYLSPGVTDHMFKALDAGAIEVLSKPKGPRDPETPAAALKIRQTIKAAARVKVVRRHPRRPRAASSQVAGESAPAPSQCVVVAIGASTGGPPVIKTILSSLAAPFSIPILVVQHIAPGFLPGLLSWLKATTHLRPVIGESGALLEPGHIYFAPDGAHMTVNHKQRLSLHQGPLKDGVRPSASHLFSSLAGQFQDRAVGILLSGMGRDGAEGLKAMRDYGAVTIVQDKESAAVYGMPDAALGMGGACHVWRPEQMADFLNRLTPGA